MPSEFIAQQKAELDATPTLAGDPFGRAWQADRDAAELAADIRELDPRQLWGRLNLWGHENPTRLLAATISLAAMVDPAHLVAGRSPTWTLPLGGTEALHPDHTPRGPVNHERRREHRKKRLGNREADPRILDMWFTTTLNMTEIGEHLFVDRETVSRCLTRHHIPTRRTTWNELATTAWSMFTAGARTIDIAATTGLRPDIVDRIISGQIGRTAA